MHKKAEPGLVAYYGIQDIRPGNGAGLFLQPRSPHGAVDEGNFGQMSLLTQQRLLSVSVLGEARSVAWHVRSATSTNALEEEEEEDFA